MWIGARSDTLSSTTVRTIDIYLMHIRWIFILLLFD